jgi:DNA (cytosine-5)-methyltransferase 1
MSEFNAELRKWLIETKLLSKKSASDVICRLKRAKTFINIDISDNTETLLFHLSENPVFKTLTQSVRSQLKRAVRLYKDFNTKA